MREEKWGILERFRVRPEWRDRALAADPHLFNRALDARAPLLHQGAFVLGPFLLKYGDGEWWTLLWQFPTRDLAEGLRPFIEDAGWQRYVESQLIEGEKHDPRAALPGF